MSRFWTVLTSTLVGAGRKVGGLLLKTAILFLVVDITVLYAQAQSCGNPTFTCSTSLVCTGSSWSCSCGGTECIIPPSQYVCTGYGTPDCGSSGWYCNPGGSPIIVDTTGKGFHLTSAEAGVVFDIAGTGIPVRIGWTAAGSGNAFLALDRNGNGRIDDGKELFGNYTSQPQSDHPNGYLALAEYDKAKNGGNGDGIIDARDAIYSRLLLWIDGNHDGISQPSELYTLPELGAYSINLHYRTDRLLFDQYGNWFHYHAVLNPTPQDGESKDGRLTYDVFFVVDHKYVPDVRASRKGVDFHLPPM